MPEFGREIQWAARLIAATLEGVFVHPVDPGVRHDVHDLDVERAGRVFAAVAVAPVADEECLTLWNLVNDRNQRWVEPTLTGGWTVGLLSYARAAAIRARVPRLLESLERLQIRSLRSDEESPSPQTSEARRLGVATATHHDSRVAGTIYLTIYQPEQPAQAPVATGETFREWLADWIRDSQQADQLSRLDRSFARERHLFAILPGFTTAPPSVAQLLLRDDPPLPAQEPELPEVVTHVWVASTWATGMGIRWAPDTGWSRFHKL